MKQIITIHNRLRCGDFPKEQLETVPGVTVIITPSKTIHFHEEIVITIDDSEEQSEQDVLEIAFELGRLTQLCLMNNK